MTDRFISNVWWATSMAMICGTGVVGIYVGYGGMLDLLAFRWTSATAGLAVAVGCAVGTWQLCRFRNDLL